MNSIDASEPGVPVTARAHANIALVKYWGKRDRALNLPAEGSLSLTLAALTTRTTVRFGADLAADRLLLDGTRAAGKALARLSAWLDLVRRMAGLDLRAEVVSENDFPTASGLASSASAYAALALAASRAAGLDLDARTLSVLARRGSGSAARSIHGGFVRMHRGRRPDGEDAFAEPLAAGAAGGLAGWPVRMVIAVVGGGKAKAHGSRDAMEHCAETSPLYTGWLASVPGDLLAAEQAIAARDIDALGRVAEASALAMHASALAARPAIVYWQPPTLACMEAVRDLRDRGVPAYYTMDAGPHVKVLTLADHAADVAAALRAVPGVTDVMTSAPGGGAAVTGAGEALDDTATGAAIGSGSGVGHRLRSSASASDSAAAAATAAAAAAATAAESAAAAEPAAESAAEPAAESAAAAAAASEAEAETER